jgi:hypothetical protein
MLKFSFLGCNSTTRLYLVGSFYEFYITMHGSMNINGINVFIFTILMSRFNTSTLLYIKIQ